MNTLELDGGETLSSVQAAAMEAFVRLVARERVRPALALLRHYLKKLDVPARNLALRAALRTILAGVEDALEVEQRPLLRISMGVVEMLGSGAWKTAEGVVLQPRVASQVAMLYRQSRNLVPKPAEVQHHLVAARLAVACVDAGLPLADQMAPYLALIPLKSLAQAKRLWAEMVEDVAGVPSPAYVQRVVERRLHPRKRSAVPVFRVESTLLQQRFALYAKLLPRAHELDRLRHLLRSDRAALAHQSRPWCPEPDAHLIASPTAPEVTESDGLLYVRDGSYVQCGFVEEKDPRNAKLIDAVIGSGGDVWLSELPGTKGPMVDITFVDEARAASYRDDLLKRVNSPGGPRWG